MKCNFLSYFKLQGLLSNSTYNVLYDFLMKGNYSPNNVLKIKPSGKHFEEVFYSFSEEPVILRYSDEFSWYIFFKGFYLKIDSFTLSIHINKNKDFFTIPVNCYFSKEDRNVMFMPSFYAVNDNCRKIATYNIVYNEDRSVESGEWNSYIYDKLSSFIKRIKKEQKDALKNKKLSEQKENRKEYNDAWSN